VPSYTTQEKREAAAVLAETESLHAVANRTGIHRRTIARWRDTDEGFKADLDTAQKKLAEDWSVLSTLALAEMKRKLEDPAQAKALKLRDLAGVLHLAAQHWDRVTDRLPQVADDQDMKPLTEDELTELLQALPERVLTQALAKRAG
jgi:phosphotransferase system HPr-like phosphotransfer protein